MGLAMSLVAMEKEKVKNTSTNPTVKFVRVCDGVLPRLQVWYHVCPNRGRGCYNTRLKEDGGCTIWYNEKEVRKDGHLQNIFEISLFLANILPLSQLLSEIEEHLKCTITHCGTDIKVPVDEFDGKVTYGQRKALGGMLDPTRPQIYCFFCCCCFFFNKPHQPCSGGNYKGHVDALAPTVQELANLEREAQTSFLHLGYLPNQLFRAF